MPIADAIVIGSGPNGLVAANLLADAGWEVIVLEAQDTPGGAVRSDTAVHPGFVHDTFSSFYPLAVASPTIRGLGLEQHGLVWVHAPAVVGTPLPVGRVGPDAPVDREATAAALDAQAPGDGEAGWRCARVGPHRRRRHRRLLAPFPPVRAGCAPSPACRASGGLGFVQMMLAPLQTMAEQRFSGRGAHLLLGGNAAHADIPVMRRARAPWACCWRCSARPWASPCPRRRPGELSRALVDAFRRRRRRAW